MDMPFRMRACICTKFHYFSSRAIFIYKTWPLCVCVWSIWLADRKIFVKENLLINAFSVRRKRPKRPSARALRTGAKTAEPCFRQRKHIRISLLKSRFFVSPRKIKTTTKYDWLNTQRNNEKAKEKSTISYKKAPVNVFDSLGLISN